MSYKFFFINNIYDKLHLELQRSIKINKQEQDGKNYRKWRKTYEGYVNQRFDP